MALTAALAVTLAEYIYDATAAVTAVIVTVILIASVVFSCVRSQRPLPLPVRYFLIAVQVVCVLGITGTLLIGDAVRTGTVFAVAHYTIVITACIFIMAWRTRQYAQIFVTSLLLVVIAAVTGGSAILVPPFVLYMLFAAYCLMRYQLQRQTELVAATRFIGAKRTPEDDAAVHADMQRWHAQLPRTRLALTFGAIMSLTIILASLVFFAFPRLEAGSLLGGRFSSTGVTGFTDKLVLGSIDKDVAARHVVARVTVDPTVRKKISQDDRLYLRCVSLDRYTESEALDGSFSWRRSPLCYVRASDPPPSRPQQDSPLVTQQILLSAQAQTYLPALHPTNDIRLRPDTPLRLSAIDNVADQSALAGQTVVDYVVHSFTQIMPQQAHSWFNRNLKLLGNYWLSYGSNLLPARQEIRSVAHAIAGESTELRQTLQQDQTKAFNAWLGYLNRHRYQRSDARRTLRLPSAKTYPEMTDEPNYPDADDPRSLALINDLYQSSLKLADLDRAIAQKIVDYLRNNHQYSTSPAPAPLADQQDYLFADPVTEFITAPGATGNCEYFSSAMVLLCRALGIRSRLAVGYLVQDNPNRSRLLHGPSVRRPQLGRNLHRRPTLGTLRPHATGFRRRDIRRTQLLYPYTQPSQQ